MNLESVLKHRNLYQTDLSPLGWSVSFIWRLLSQREYKVFSVLRSTVPDYVLYDEVFEYCYVGDSSFLQGSLPIGITISIGQLIMYLSGDQAVEDQKLEFETFFNQYQRDSVQEYMIRIILQVFNYTPQALEDLSRPEFLRTFLIADTMLQEQGQGDMVRLSSIFTEGQNPHPGHELFTPDKIMSPEDIQKAQIKAERREMFKDKQAGLEASLPQGAEWLDLEPEEFAKKQAIAKGLISRGVDLRRK